MDTCRSYCLNSRRVDFAELDAEARQPDTTDIHYVIPANDNSPSKVRLIPIRRDSDSPAIPKSAAK
jgi:hypothetical protein